MAKDQNLLPRSSTGTGLTAKTGRYPASRTSKAPAIDFSSSPVRLLTTPRPRMENPAHLHLESQESAAGANSKMYLLNKLARMLGAENYELVMWEDIRFPLVTALMARLRDEEYAPSTRCAYLAVIRGTAKSAWAMQSMDLESYQRIQSIVPPRFHREKTGKAHDIEVIRLLLKACDTDPGPLSKRDGVMIALLVATGIRRQECARIQLSNIDFRTHEIRLVGKGNKERVVKIPDSVWTRLIDYLDNSRKYEPGALIVRFWNKRLTPVVDAKGMDVSSINRRLDNVRRRVRDLLGVNITPHDLRRTFTTNLYQLGLSLRELQVLLGHASMTTTEGYLHDEKDDYRAKAAKLTSDYY